MNVYDFRRVHFVRLVDESGFTKKRFAEKYGLSAGHVSQMYNSHRDMGDEVARRIEKALGLASGFMDLPPKDMGGTMEPIEAYEIREWETEDDLSLDTDVLIPVVDVQLSAGGGADNAEFVITRFKIPFQRYWLRDNGLHPDDVRVMKVKGDSMRPTMNDGDSVLVDITKKTVRDDKIYALATHKGALIKRLQVTVDGSLRIISDNPSHREEVVGPDSQEHVVIIGEVVWRSGLL